MINKPNTVIEYLEYFITTQKRLSNKGRTEGTIRTYETRGRYLREFLRMHRMENCNPSDITIHLIREYEVYLIANRNFSNDYAMKCIQLFGRLLRAALENKDINSNPFDLFDYHYQRDKKIIYLEIEDLKRIKSAKLNTCHRRTRDLFLFGCYTGLCFADIQQFDYEKHIIKGPDQNEWIYLNRKKNKAETYVPLIPEAKEILEYYYKKLPVKSNQQTNKGLKVIGKKAKIKQLLTSHVARKTFGNILHNELNVSIETVSSMLGHKSIKTTQSWYVNTNVKKIMNDMKGISFSKVA